MMSMRLFFFNLTDPRQAMKVRHDLLEIIAITIIAVAADCDGWDEIEDFGNQYEEWLRNVVGLEMKYGPPTAGTLARVWSALDSKEGFQAGFLLYSICIIVPSRRLRIPWLCRYTDWEHKLWKGR